MGKTCSPSVHPGPDTRGLDRGRHLSSPPLSGWESEEAPEEPKRNVPLAFARVLARARAGRRISFRRQIRIEAPAGFANICAILCASLM